MGDEPTCYRIVPTEYRFCDVISVFNIGGKSFDHLVVLYYVAFPIKYTYTYIPTFMHIPSRVNINKFQLLIGN